MDTKAGLLLTFVLAAAGLVLAGQHHALGYLSLAGYAVAAGLALACLAARGWANAPDPAVLLSMENADEGTVYRRLLAEKAQAFRFNSTGLREKADWLKITTWWLAVPVVLTVSSFLV